MTASAIVGHISHSGTAANNYGPFLPLASGDTGVSNVASVTMSAANTAGVMALCLAKPLLTLPLTTVSVAAERDLLNQLPSLPRVMDGACLTWLYFAGAATGASTNFYGAVEFGWG
jgi:phage tail sheath gpL-like